MEAIATTPKKTTLKKVPVKLINEIKSKFYNVVLEPARVSTPEFEQPKDTYFVYNEKSGKQIGKKSVGKDFLPMQQHEFLNNILLTVQGFGAELDLNSLRFRSYCNDSKIEFAISTVEPLAFKNRVNRDDKTYIELVFSTSYDGTKSNRIGLFIVREVCSNGMTVKDIQGELKGRNTLGGKTKILSYALEVAEMVNGVKDYKSKMIELDKRVVTKAEIEDFKLKLFGYNEATLKGKSDKETRLPLELLNNFDLAMQKEFPRTGETAFGLLQSVTYYTNHIANQETTNKNGEIKPRANTNDEFIRYATGAKVNDKAQELIYAMV